MNSVLKRSLKTQLYILGYNFIHFIPIITRVTLICAYIIIIVYNIQYIYTRASSGDTALSNHSNTSTQLATDIQDKGVRFSLHVKNAKV